MKLRYMALLLLCLIFFRVGAVSASAESDLTALSHGSREEKKIALTFDDGPHPRYTAEILALLAEYKVKATFFMIGTNVSHYPELARRVAKEGHEIGSHTFSHPHMLKITPSALLDEIDKTERVFAENHIPKPTLFRPPEGYRTKEQSLAVKNAGYTMVVWSIDTHDWQSRPSTEIVNYVHENVQGGDILLFHDYISGQNTTITALKQLIPKLLEDGYCFTVVSDLIS